MDYLPSSSVLIIMELQWSCVNRAPVRWCLLPLAVLSFEDA